MLVGVAMDASDMSTAIWLLMGLAGGTAHFALLRHSTELYVAGNAARALLVQALRIATTTVLLAFAVSHGAAPLLLTTLGLSGVRPFILHRTAGAQ